MFSAKTPISKKKTALCVRRARKPRAAQPAGPAARPACDPQGGARVVDDGVTTCWLRMPDLTPRQSLRSLFPDEKLSIRLLEMSRALSENALEYAAWNCILQPTLRTARASRKASDDHERQHADLSLLSMSGQGIHCNRFPPVPAESRWERGVILHT